MKFAHQHFQEGLKTLVAKFDNRWEHFLIDCLFCFVSLGRSTFLPVKMNVKIILKKHILGWNNVESNAIRISSLLPR